MMMSPIQRVTHRNAVAVIGFIEEDRMEPYQDRVVVEKEELDEKINRLSVFVHNKEKMSLILMIEQMHLMSQLTIMRAYSSVLEDRIAFWR